MLTVRGDFRPFTVHDYNVMSARLLSGKNHRQQREPHDERPMRGVMPMYSEEPDFQVRVPGVASPVSMW